MCSMPLCCARCCSSCSSLSSDCLEATWIASRPLIGHPSKSRPQQRVPLSRIERQRCISPIVVRSETQPPQAAVCSGRPLGVLVLFNQFPGPHNPHGADTPCPGGGGHTLPIAQSARLSQNNRYTTNARCCNSRHIWPKFGLNRTGCDRTWAGVGGCWFDNAQTLSDANPAEVPSWLDESVRGGLFPSAFDGAVCSGPTKAACCSVRCVPIPRAHNGCEPEGEAVRVSSVSTLAVNGSTR